MPFEKIADRLPAVLDETLLCTPIFPKLVAAMPSSGALHGYKEAATIISSNANGQTSRTATKAKSRVYHTRSPLDIKERLICAPDLAPCPDILHKMHSLSLLVLITTLLGLLRMCTLVQPFRVGGRMDFLTEVRNCGISSQHVATLSDCRAMLSSAHAFQQGFRTEDTCVYVTTEGYVRLHKTRVVQCKGDCCIGYAAPFQSGFDIDVEQTQAEAKDLLKCHENAGKDKISARKMFKDGHGICLLEGKSSCGCFDELREW